MNYEQAIQNLAYKQAIENVSGRNNLEEVNYVLSVNKLVRMAEKEKVENIDRIYQLAHNFNYQVEEWTKIKRHELKSSKVYFYS